MSNGLHEELLAFVQEAVARFCREHHYLLNVDASERAISHKLAEVMQRGLWARCCRRTPLARNERLVVDCEYNRDIDESKTVPLLRDEFIKFVSANVDAGLSSQQLATLLLEQQEESKSTARVFPDIIVHERGTTENVVVVEVKKYVADATETKKQKEDRAWDAAKLALYKKELGYQFAAHLFLMVADREAGDASVDDLFKGAKLTAI